LLYPTLATMPHLYFQQLTLPTCCYAFLSRNF
jgi:hypothetical protein